MARTDSRTSVPETSAPKRKPGRPRKESSPHPSVVSVPTKTSSVSAGAEAPKRKPGRPPKAVTGAVVLEKRKPGRPPKAVAGKTIASGTRTVARTEEVAAPKPSIKTSARAASKTTANVVFNKAASSKASSGRRSIHPLVLGIDMGGSGIKGAPVDLEKGLLVVDRARYDTPQPSTPAACTDVIAQLVADFEPMTAAKGPVGVTFPGVVWDGTTLTAANVDHDWIGLDADAMLEERLKRKVTVLNDAQAAALAEVHYGAGRGVDGMVLMLTFGTGIGSGLVYRGVALPGVELGHVRMHGRDAEQLAAASVKDNKKLSWKAWSERVNDYLARIELMLWPELIIIGGGVSEESEKFLSRLKTRTPVVPAKLGNSAGIVGAAIAASRKI